MAVLRFEPNEPLEVALKFDTGLRVSSAKYPEAPDQMKYTLCGEDSIYTPLGVAEQIEKLGIRKLELFSICKRVQNRITRWEVKRLGDAATPALPAQPPTDLEDQLTRSIEQIKNQRAIVTPAGPQQQKQQQSEFAATNTQPIIAHTRASKLMAGALIAAIDAAREAEVYAAGHGIELEFGAEDVQKIAATLFIAASKDPGFLHPEQPANGGSLWQSQ